MSDESGEKSGGDAKPVVNDPVPPVTSNPEPTLDPEVSTQWAQDAEGNVLPVPYVATPQILVDKMIEMASLQPDDVLFDLGCGDGRIVIAAAKEMGVKGVGIDLDPKRIGESKHNAQVAGVTDLTTFLQEDIFKVDLSSATVVTLYLVPEVNKLLLPKLIKELKPGTRLLSHNYGFEGWEPSRVETVEIPGKHDYAGTHSILYWEIPEKFPDQLLVTPPPGAVP
jgi:SAM-dependent methyltransferase